MTGNVYPCPLNTSSVSESLGGVKHLFALEGRDYLAVAPTTVGTPRTLAVPVLLLHVVVAWRGYLSCTVDVVSAQPDVHVM